MYFPKLACIVEKRCLLSPQRSGIDGLFGDGVCIDGRRIWSNSFIIRSVIQIPCLSSACRCRGIILALEDAGIALLRCPRLHSSLVEIITWLSSCPSINRCICMCNKVYTIIYYRYAHMQAMVSLPLFLKYKRRQEPAARIPSFDWNSLWQQQAKALNPARRDPASWLYFSSFPWWLVVHRSPDQLSH